MALPPSTLHQAAGRTTLAALVVLVVDQATKLGATLLSGGHRNGMLVPIRNARFSLGLAGASTLVELLLMAAGVALAAAYGIHALRQGRLPAWALGLVVGGALSNLADRLLLGSVRDFLAIGHLVVNLADLAVLAGLVGFALIRFPKPTHSDYLRKEVRP